MTWAGQELGWRMSFTFVCLGIVLTGLMVSLFVHGIAPDKNATPLKELSALRSPGTDGLWCCVSGIRRDVCRL